MSAKCYECDAQLHMDDNDFYCPICRSQEEIKKLQAENKKLRECVEYYSDTEKNYVPIQVSPNPDCRGIHYCDDEGKRARQCLKEITEQKENDE